MRQNVGPGVIAVIFVVVIAIIGFAAYKSFGPKATTVGEKPKGAAAKTAADMANHPVDMRKFNRDNPPPTSGGGH